jgi:lysophospholipase L1-like esterase
MTKKVVLFGDSITAGWEAPHERTILADLVKHYLAEVGKTDVEVVLKGVPGEDTEDGLARLEDVASVDADFNIILFGANDAGSHHAITPAEFEENLVAFAVKLGLEKTILVTPPYHNDAVGDNRRSNKFIEEYREKTISAAAKIGAPVIDLYHQMTVYPAPNEFLQDDGLHLSQDGYELLASMYAIVLRNII